MYRKDVFTAKGLTVPDNPTCSRSPTWPPRWNGAQPGMKGICLRGPAGLGRGDGAADHGGNTFGGTWFTKDWQAQVNSPQFHPGDVVLRHLVKRTARRVRAGRVHECLNDFEQGKVAMWYDATSAAGSLDDPSSPVAGKVGTRRRRWCRRRRPAGSTPGRGASQKASKHSADAWKFCPGRRARTTRTWSASSWAGPGAGRQALLDVHEPGLPEGRGRLLQATETAIDNADPRNPGGAAAADDRTSLWISGVHRSGYPGVAVDQFRRSPDS